MAADAAAIPPGRLQARGSLGTVDTVAGPGFCDGVARPDPATSRVGALAADADGRLWFESGAPGNGLLTQVVGSTSVAVRRTGVKFSAAPPRRGASRAPSATASRLAADHGGGVLIATPSAVLHLGGGLTTVAGTRSPSPEDNPGTGDGGPLEAARFSQILAIASDADGNVYLADEVDGDSSTIAIRFLNRSGSPRTFYAGTPHELSVAPGSVATIFGGRGGPRLKAEAPVLAAAADRLYIGGRPPGAPARANVQLLNAGGQDLSAHGVTFAPRVLATIATAGTRSRRDVTGSPSESALSGLAADDMGNLYMAEPASHRVMRVDATGTRGIFAGTGRAGFNGNDRLATGARLDRPYDVDVGAGGRVYISDAGNAQVRVVDQAGTIRSALGNGLTNRWACGDRSGEAKESRGAANPGNPKSLAADASGNIYLTADLGRVYRLNPSGSLHSVAGRDERACADPGACRAADDAPLNEAYLHGLTTVAPGPAGGLYVIERSRVRFLNLGRRPVEAHGVTVPGGAMRTVAGAIETGERPTSTSTPEFTIYEDPVTGRSISTPASVVLSTIPDGAKALTESPIVEYTAVTVDRSGNLIAVTVPNGGRSSPGTNSVRQVDHSGIVTTLVGPTGRDPRDGSFDRDRCCAAITDLATDAAGNVYIADWGFEASRGRVWLLNRGPSPVVAHGVTVGPGALAVVAGTFEAGSQDEGIPALRAHMSYPAGIALDATGNLYIADADENAVQRVDADGIITTVVGTGQPGFNGDGLKGTLTALNNPFDVLSDTCGNLLVADSANNRVRRLNLGASCAGAASAPLSRHARRPVAAVVTAGAAIVGLVLVGSVLSRRGHVRRPRERRPSAS